MNEEYVQLEFDFSEAIVCDEEVTEEIEEIIKDTNQNAEEPEQEHEETGKPKTANEVLPKIYKTQEDIQRITEEIYKKGWRKISNTCGTMIIRQYNERKPMKNTGFELFTRRRTISQIVEKDKKENLQEKLLKKGENVENVCSYPHNITEKMAKDRKKPSGDEMPLCGADAPLAPKLAPNISGASLPIRDSMAFSSIYRLKRSGRIDLYRHSDSNTDKSSDKRSAPVPDCS